MCTMEQRKRLVLLDTHAIIHRAYHALPDFSSSKGEPTGALYGITSMLLRIISELKPDYLIATRDLPGPTHRHKKFEAYKGTRTKADDALISQLESAPKVFEAFGIPMYAAAGFEADDCIGTIVHGLKPHNHVDTIIASGDMDTFQLISPSVVVYTMRKGINDTVLYDEDAVKERYGFGPEHVVDYKALRGDPSDNIPGIKGIGEKTATEIIVRFGSIEHLYEIIEKDPDALKKAGIKTRMIELLTNGKQEALFSKDLATISTDAPINFVLPEKEWGLADHVAKIESLCDELEFRSLKERVRVVARMSTPEQDAVPMIDVDPKQLAEASIALWLLNSDIANPSIQDILDYAHTDDFEQARAIIFEKLKTTGRLQEVYERVEQLLISVIERMNTDGVGVDVNRLKSLSKEYTKGLGEIAARIYRHAGHEFNINSPKQLGVVLYDELQIGSGGKQKKTATGARTTKESELEKLAEAHPVIGDVLAYRELQKLLSTYIDKLPALVGKDSRLHAEFISAGAMTGRMTSKEPNLQNIPVKTEYGRRIREAFVAEQGNVLVAIDYSQIELRIAAGLSGDIELVRIFKAGDDVHTATASRVFGVSPEKVDKEMRRRAKVINFGILYGMGVNALRANLGNVSREESAQYLEEYFKKFAGLAKWIEETKALAEKNGYTETLYGRRRYFSGFKSTLPGLRAQAERMAVNAPIQGTQADIIKLAMISADNLIEKNGWRERVRLVLQVHDELVYEIEKNLADEASAVLKHAMEDVVAKDMLSGVPIIAEVSVGANWGDLKKINLKKE